MALQKGICKNFGECDLADSKEVQEVEKSNFVCEECGKPLFQLEGTKTTTKGGNNDKVKLIAIIAAILVVLAGAGYGIWSALSGTDEPKEIEVNQHEKTLNEGDTFQLEVMSLGDLKGKVQLEWSVTDGEDCISVDENGLVTAKREGRGTVNVCLAKKPELQDDCIINVLKKVNDTDTTTEQSQKPETDNGKTEGPGSGTIALGYATYTGPLKDGKPHGIGGEVKVTRAYSLDLKKSPAEYVELNRGDKIVNTKFVNGELRQGEIHFADGTRRWVNL